MVNPTSLLDPTGGLAEAETSKPDAKGKSSFKPLLPFSGKTFIGFGGDCNGFSTKVSSKGRTTALKEGGAFSKKGSFESSKNRDGAGLRNLSETRKTFRCVVERTDSIEGGGLCLLWDWSIGCIFFLTES
jgi:hypothetical protein